jgi:hypothetical protein
MKIFRINSRYYLGMLPMVRTHKNGPNLDALPLVCHRAEDEGHDNGVHRGVRDTRRCQIFSITLHHIKRKMSPKSFILEKNFKKQII